MKIFVTGGTGFIGRCVVEKLVQRGLEVYALARSEPGALLLRQLGAIPVIGDVTQLETMRQAMTGADVVFHLAGWYKLGSCSAAQAEAVNVGGARNVLELAHELSVPKIIYTSTVAVFGDTARLTDNRQLVDETFPIPVGPLLTEYDRTKWRGYHEVVVPLVRRGAPIITLMPGAVYGPQDHSLVGQLMRAYYHGWFFLFPGPETLLSCSHVDDVAEGHLLAMDKGQPGENYLLAGPAIYLSEAVKIWAAASGKPTPLAYVPARWVKTLEPLARFLGSWLPMPELMSVDAVRVLGASYAGDDEKAARQLGWRARPVEVGFRQTFAWIVAHDSSAAPRSLTCRRTAGVLFGLAALTGLLALFGRKHR
jgi:dihydroflavonol-4-reductase